MSSLDLLRALLAAGCISQPEPQYGVAMLGAYTSRSAELRAQADAAEKEEKRLEQCLKLKRKAEVLIE